MDKKAACVLPKSAKEKKDKPLNDRKNHKTSLIIIKKEQGKLLLKKEERYEKENGKQNADDWTCFSYDGRNVCRLWKLCTCGSNRQRFCRYGGP